MNKAKLKQCPCKDCELKGCGDFHDFCRKYAEFNKARRIYLDKRFNESKQDPGRRTHGRGKLGFNPGHRQ